MDEFNKLFDIADIGLVTAILDINIKNYDINKKILNNNKKNSEDLQNVLTNILLELKSINEKLK